MSGHTNEQKISVSSFKDSLYAYKPVPLCGFGDLHSVNMSMALPLYLVRRGRESAVLADHGWLIYPEMDEAHAVATCRSYSSIYCAHSMWIV